MKLTLKTQLLNLFRLIFKIPFLERGLVSLTTNQPPDSFAAKLVPNPYQYPKPTWRRFTKNNITLNVDISDYLGHYYYFGFSDTSHSSLERLCEVNMTVLDIGTNLGYTALMMAKKAASGKVIGFEPDPQNFELCQRNLRSNNLPNLEVHKIGLGASAMSATIETRVAFNRGGNRINENASHGVLVQVHALDEYAATLGIDRVDLIKIDVEGYEFQVLKGAEQTIRSHKPILFIEVDDSNLKDQGASAEMLITFIKNLGYAIKDAETNRAIDSGVALIDQHLDIIATP